MEEKIKRLIFSSGFPTIKSAAKKMGVSEAYLGMALSKRAKISWNMAFKLEKLLGLPAYEIMEGQLKSEYRAKIKEKENE